uniref:Uncharacterized protein n=1 Tax=Proboscia inermis TaxID=420281 RepID=A0A7S0C3R7_9STRA
MRTFFDPFGMVFLSKKTQKNSDPATPASVPFSTDDDDAAPSSDISPCSREAFAIIPCANPCPKIPRILVPMNSLAGSIPGDFFKLKNNMDTMIDAAVSKYKHRSCEFQ